MLLIDLYNDYVECIRLRSWCKVKTILFLHCEDFGNESKELAILIYV